MIAPKNIKKIIVQLTISLSNPKILLLKVEKPPVAIVVIEWHKALKKFIINSKNIARTGTKVKNNNINGVVTSGNYSPILEKSIGFALFDSSPESDLLEFDIRGNFIEGNIINKRFLS